MAGGPQSVPPDGWGGPPSGDGVGVGGAWEHVGEREGLGQTVRACLGGRGLAGHLRDVVVKADVAGRVIVLQQLTLGAQRAVEVGGGRARPERGGVALVLELNDQDVGDLPGGEGRSKHGGGAGVANGSAGGRSGERDGAGARGQDRHQGAREEKGGSGSVHGRARELPGPPLCARPDAYSRAKPAMSRAVSRLMSGQAMLKISGPCIVPLIWWHRAGTP